MRGREQTIRDQAIRDHSVRDQAITVQGALAVVAIAAMLAYAAYSLELAPHDQVAAYSQEMPMHPAASYPAAANPVVSDLAVPSSFYTGTVVKNGTGFLLRGASGALYDLDDALKAQPFAGKAVKVTGKLNETAKLIHIEKIEEVPA